MKSSYEDEFNKIVVNFIQKNYTVSRVKHNMRFRRAIIFDDGQVHLLADEPTTRAIKNKVSLSIQKIFAFNKEEANKFITQVLNI